VMQGVRLLCGIDKAAEAVVALLGRPTRGRAHEWDRAHELG
jgi:hypothetical protein